MTVRRKKIVLVADDKRAVRSYIRAIIENSFSDYDLEIFTAPSSDTALRIIEQLSGNIDLVSTNINRPGMDGIMFIHFVRSKYPHIKVLICSGSIRTDDLRSMFNAGLADAYIRKPIRERDYVNAVRNLFESQKVVRLNFQGGGK
ncbi:MAG: response regulator [Desulfomonilia bacterium]|jgi:two-component system chemotaxis response regulator CheY